MAAVLRDINVVLKAKLGNFNRGMKNAEGSLRSLGASIGVMGAAVGAGMGVVIATTSRFEKQMVRTAAMAGGTEAKFRSSFDAMKGAALDLAGATAFTGIQVAQGMEKLAMAGADAQTTIAAMPSVLQLSTAASVDLAEAADTVTNVMAGFGKSTDELPSSVNTLVAVFTGANTTLSELGEAMKNAGPVAKTLGMSMEGTAVALGLLGNAGIKAGEAGTGLKRAMTAMVNVTKKSGKAMEILGLKTSDLTSDNKGFGTIIAKLEGTKQAFSEVGMEAEFTAQIFKLFGERAGPKMAALVEQGADSFDKLMRKVKDAKDADLAGFLERAQLETFSGQLDLLASAFEKVQIRLGQVLMPTVKEFVQEVKAVLEEIGKWDEANFKMVAEQAAFAAKVAGSALAVIGLTVAIKAMMVIAAPLIALVGALVALYVGFKLGQDALAASTVLFSGKARESEGALKVMGDALSYAMEGVAEAEATISNFVIAMGQAIVKVVSFGMLDLDDIFGGLASKISDAARAERDLLPHERQVTEASDKIRKLKKEIKDYGFELKFTTETIKKFKGGMREFDVPVIPKGVTEVIRQKRGGEVATDAPEILEKISELYDEIRKKQAGLYRSAEFQHKQGVKRAEEEKKVLGEQADKAKRVAETEAAARKARLVTRGILTAADSDAAKQARLASEGARESISGMLLNVTRDLEKLDDKGIAPVLSAIDSLEDASKDLAKSFKNLFPTSEGLITEEGLADWKKAADVAGLLEKRVIAQASAFLRSKEGTEEYADLVDLSIKKLKKALGRDITSDELDLFVGPTIPKDILEERLKIDKIDPNKILPKSFSDNLGDAIQTALAGAFGGGGGGGIGATIGTAIGAAFGSPQVGAMIGQAADDMMAEIENKITGFFDLIPDERFSAAANSAFDAFKDIGKVLLQLPFPLQMVVGLFLAIVGPLGAFFGVLSTQTESFKRWSSAFSESIDRVVLALEPIFQKLMFLPGLFDVLMRALITLIPSEEALSVVASHLFSVFKWLALATLGFGIALASLVKASLWVSEKIVDATAAGMNLFLLAIETTARALAFFLGKIPGMGGFAAAAIVAAEGVEDHRRGVQEERGDFSTFVEGVSPDLAALVGLFNEVYHSTEEGMSAFGEGLASAADSANELAESLVNVPQGFKVALERFRAISTGEGGTITAGGDNATASIAGEVAAGGRGIYANEIVINITGDDEKSILESVLDEIAKKNGEFTGNPFGKQFNPGFG